MKKISIFLLAILCMAFQHSHAQWAQISSEGIPDTVETSSITSHNNALYVNTSAGIYTSPSGEGGDWTLYGTGIDTADIGDVSFSDLGVYAVADGYLVKLNETSDNWEYVNATADTFEINSNFQNFGNLFSVKDGNTTYLFAGGWQCQAAFRYDGSEWTAYNDTTTEDADDVAADTGLAANWGYRIILRHWAASSDGRVYVNSKSVVQMTDDYGETWYWRRGNAPLYNQSNSRDLIVRNYNGTEYLIFGHAHDYSSNWNMGMSEVNEDVGLEWTQLDTNYTVMNPDLESYSENLFFARSQSSGNVFVSYDNGYTWSKMMSGMSPEDVSELYIRGDSLFVTKSTNDYYVYDVNQSPQWMSGFPAICDTVSSTAVKFGFSSNSSGKGFYVALPQSEAAPTAAQIKAGQDADGNPAAISGQIDVTGQDTNKVEIPGFSVGTAYTIYALTENRVLNDSEVKTVSFDPPTFNATFTVMDSFDSTAVADARVTFNQDTLLTSSDGVAEFTGVPSGVELTYTVNKTDYTPVSNTITTPNHDIADTVYLEASHQVSFTVLKKADSTAVEGASVIFNNDTLETNTDGTVVFEEVASGVDMPYKVTKTDYNTVTGTIDVTADTDKTVYLPQSYSATFTVLNITDSSAVADAKVYFNDDTVATNADGIAVFNEVSAGAEQPYSIHKDLYQPLSGTIDVENEDFTGNFYLTPKALSLTSPQDGDSFEEGSDVEFTTELHISQDSVSKVTYFVNGTVLEEVTEYPYNYTWNDVGPGEYTIVLKVYDTQENVIDSSQVDISVWEKGEAGDNPVAVFYEKNTGYPGWMNEINWGNVVYMSDQGSGSANFERFEEVRDSLYNQGGGVMYYPGGTYEFAVEPGPNGRGLMLKEGVILLGQQPTTDSLAAKSHETPGLSSLPTTFQFTYNDLGDGDVPYMWNCIGITPGANEDGIGDVDRVGVAWINLKGAYIYFGFGAQWAESWGASDGWMGSIPDMGNGDASYPAYNGWENRNPDGTHIIDPWAGDGTEGKWNSGDAQMGSKRFVFGCRLDNSCVTNYGIDGSGGQASDASDFYTGSFKWAGRLTVYGSDVFVANNVISKPGKGFLHEQMTSEGQQTVKFDYGDGIGIDVNKNMLSLYGNRCVVDGGPYYLENIVIRDNWVYNHGDKGYEISGKWVTIKNNINYRDYLQEGDDPYNKGWSDWILLENPGYQHVDGATDNMSRAFDLGGWNLWIDNNWYTGTGSNPGNDGEGILWQRNNAVECFSASVTGNAQGETGEDGYVGPYDTHVMGLMVMDNQGRGDFGLYNHKQGNVAEDLSIVSNTGAGNEVINGPGVVNDSMFTAQCPGTIPAAAEIDTLYREPGNHRTVIKWSDNADCEAGFRIDRKLQGSDEWITIAYRPRHESDAIFNYNPGQEGGPVTQCANQEYDFNPETWIDYTAEMNKAYDYKVLAINCEDEGSAAIDSIVPPKVEKPALSVEGGLHHNFKKLGLSTATDGAEIRYTLDGTIPTPSSELYTDSLQLDSSVTITARAFRYDMRASDTVTVTYSFKAAAPEFSVSGGSYEETQSVTMSSETKEATIRYTLDGTAPSESSQEYTAPVSVDASLTIKARAYKEGMQESDVASASYEITDIATQAVTEGLKMHPNPAQTHVMIELTDKYRGEVRIKVTTMNGRTVKTTNESKTTENSRFRLEMGDLADGLYLIRIQCGSQEKVGKILKE